MASAVGWLRFTTRMALVYLSVGVLAGAVAFVAVTVYAYPYEAAGVASGAVLGGGIAIGAFQLRRHYARSGMSLPAGIGSAIACTLMALGALGHHHHIIR